MKHIWTILVALLALNVGLANAASPCKDAKGHFIKCPAAGASATSPAAATTPAPKKKGLLSGLMKPKAAAPATTPAAAPAPVSTPKSAPVSAMAPAAAAHRPVCKKGKPCGNSCIAMDKVCHK